MKVSQKSCSLRIRKLEPRLSKGCTRCQILLTITSVKHLTLAWWSLNSRA
ncbi:hypothetical protein Gotri_007815 [Gossypium trilobum]|nr:hypothetical protein [Gossypium trilobum]